MANKGITMLQIRRILQLLQSGFSERGVSRELHISRKTIRTYCDKFKQTDRPIEALLLMSDFSLTEIIHNKPSETEKDERFHELGKRMPLYVSELNKTGVTRQLLWNEYIKEQKTGYSYSQFCEHLSAHLDITKAVMHFEHKPGAVLQVDFAGDNLSYINKATGEIIECPVLVCVFPYSHYMYVEALVSAKQEYLFASLSRSLEYFGGVPQNIKSDNMKQYVSKSNRYEPGFTEVAEQWSLHYNTSLSATRVRKPRDKASVEKGVDLAYKRIYAPLRNEEFYSLAELNQRVFQLLEEHNRIKMQNRPYNRYERFMQDEHPLLISLPQSSFVIKHVASAKVQRNYHITLGEDWHHYSVPYKNIGKQVSLIYDTYEVEIYYEHQRIAVHRRDYRKHGYTTIKEHMPLRHQYYNESRGWDADYFLARANEIGENTEQVIKKILESRVFTEQAYNSCIGILRLGKSYGSDRLEASCKRAIQAGITTYNAIKNILEKSLDKQASITFNDELIIPEHTNLRGAEAYS